MERTEKNNRFIQILFKAPNELQCMLIIFLIAVRVRRGLQIVLKGICYF